MQYNRSIIIIYHTLKLFFPLILGVQVQPPGTEVPFMMKVCVIGCTCDLPAKAMVQNFIPFNGQYGCSYCEQPGRTMLTKRGGHVHIFPYSEHAPTGPPRTQQACEQYALEAVQRHTVVGILMFFTTSSLFTSLFI